MAGKQDWTVELEDNTVARVRRTAIVLAYGPVSAFVAAEAAHPGWRAIKAEPSTRKRAPRPFNAPRVRAIIALRDEAAARDEKAVELEENEEGVYTPIDWLRVRERAAYLRQLANDLEIS